MSYYEDKAAQAERMIRKYGSLLTLKSLVVGNYDPTTGETGNAFVDVAFYGVTLDYNPHLIDGETIRQRDLLCLMSGVSTVEPKVGDQVLFKGVLFNILNPKPLAPGAENVLYEMQLRRA